MGVGESVGFSAASVRVQGLPCGTNEFKPRLMGRDEVSQSANIGRGQLNWTKGVITMAGVFGKDPNMKKSGGRAELDRVMAERQQKLAEAAAKFLQKKPAAPTDKSGPAVKK